MAGIRIWEEIFLIKEDNDGNSNDVDHAAWCVWDWHILAMIQTYGGNSNELDHAAWCVLGVAHTCHDSNH